MSLLLTMVYTIGPGPGIGAVAQPDGPEGRPERRKARSRRSREGPKKTCQTLALSLVLMMSICSRFSTLAKLVSGS